MSMIDGLVSGLDTTSLINQLIAAERAPVDRLTTRQTSAKTAASAFANLRTLVDAVKTAAMGLDSAADWQTVKASSSSPTAATATARAGAAAGTVSAATAFAAARAARS